MKHITADDGRVSAPPKELETLLCGAFPAFYQLLGHIRWYYNTDEIWDGESSLFFSTGGELLAAIAFSEDTFCVQIADEDFKIENETALSDFFGALKKYATADQRRPADQFDLAPDRCLCGWRCDLCLGSMNSDEKNFTASENFGYMNWLCYHGCIPDKVERYSGVFKCPGCKAIRSTNDVWENWKGCKAFACLSTKGHTNCAECGEYKSCEAHINCHHPAQCNIGVSAEEITKLVIPYATKECIDYHRSQKNESR